MRPPTFATLRFSGRSVIGRSAIFYGRPVGQIDGKAPTHRTHGSQDGFALIEVIMSALLIALIVVGTFNGFDVANRATASERSRAQADTLAQQAEDKLRGAPISTLTELEATPRVEHVKQNGTEYTITSSSEFHSDSTATASCTSSAASADYLRTTSTVTWASLGTRKPVAESSIISPPPGSALIVQVTNASGEGVAGATVTATGPAPAATATTLTTATTGCAILALLPGEYNINVSRTGYVDGNWYPLSEKDPHSTHSVYLTAETTIKEPYRLAPAGTLEVKFTESVTKEGGDSFVAFNSLMATPAFRQLGTLESYAETVKSTTTVFPFAGEGKYAVYAGTCEANNPQTVNPENGPPPTISVPPEGVGVQTVTQPPVKFRVMSGTKAGKATEGVAVENAVGTLEEPKEPNGCGTLRHFKTTKEGGLPHLGMPFGEYTLCVTGGVSGGNNGATKGLAKERRYTTTFENDTPAGPSELSKMTNGGLLEESGKKFAVIYMGSGAAEAPGTLKAGSSCP